jgi:hypothetical protein
MTPEQKREVFRSLSRLDDIQTGTEFAGAMQVGDRVYWTPDGEAGTILAIDEYIIAIDWDFSGIETYSMCCGAIDRIATREERFACGRKR